MPTKPNDRLKKSSSGNSNPRIKKTVSLKIPDKEMYLMNNGESAPEAGTCSCHSVCTCVPVSECICHIVCSCDAVCSTNMCACDPHD